MRVYGDSVLFQMCDLANLAKTRSKFACVNFGESATIIHAWNTPITADEDDADDADDPDVQPTAHRHELQQARHRD